MRRRFSKDSILAWMASKLPARMKYHTVIEMWAWYTVKVNENAIASEVTVSEVIKAWDIKEKNRLVMEAVGREC